jgi:AcrR family transcriptional regulator
MKTKARILDAATALFNQHGTGAISTNHIAEAAGISPGNLYYHYRNKEEIIRAIFERLFAEWDAAFDLPTDRLPTVEDVRGLVQTNFAIISTYRFIYREIIALLQQDATLRERYLAVRERGYQGFQQLVAALVQGGVMTPPPEQDTITRLADLCWLISEFWLPTLEVSGAAVDEYHLQRGIDLMLFALQPYLAR